MRLFGAVAVAGLLALALVMPARAQSYPSSQLTAPTVTRIPLGTAQPFSPSGPSVLQTAQPPPLPRGTATPLGPRPNVQATATAASATITAADATATSVVGAPLTVVALTATALAVPTRTPSAVVSPTVAGSPTAAATALATATQAATPAATATATATATPGPNPLALTRTVLTTAPIAVGDQTLEAGTALEIPLSAPLQDNAIPGGTVVRLPNGQTLTLASGVRIPAVEQPTTVSAPLNAVLVNTAVLGDAPTPAGTALVLPAGTSVLGAVEPNATVLVRAGSSVQVDGRTRTLSEPIQVVISPTPVARPATLPRTGDADPLLWPAGVGLLLLLLGWRLRRTA